MANLCVNLTAGHYGSIFMFGVLSKVCVISKLSTLNNLLQVTLVLAAMYY